LRDAVRITRMVGSEQQRLALKMKNDTPHRD